MGTYVISDIHGCYDEFLAMLKEIGFSDSDRLLIAGDYIDRGKQSYEMLRWLEHCPENILPIRGNHDEEFASYVELMVYYEKRKGLHYDFKSHGDAVSLYESVRHILGKKGSPFVYFDAYGTIRDLLLRYDITLDDLHGWEEMIRKMPYYHETEINGRSCIVVHAGYVEEEEDISASFSCPEEFYIYAREEGYQLGGKKHGMVIAGHTPTIIKGRFTYNRGNVFRFYNRKKDCIFYDIDCGCVFREWEQSAKLACLRLEDETVFYI